MSPSKVPVCAPDALPVTLPVRLPAISVACIALAVIMPVPAPLAVISPEILISPSPTISCPVILKSASMLIVASPSVNTDTVALSVIPVKLPPPLPPCSTPPGVLPSPTYSFLVSVTYIISPSAGVILVLFASVPRLSFKAMIIVS